MCRDKAGQPLTNVGTEKAWFKIIGLQKVKKKDNTSELNIDLRHPAKEGEGQNK